MKAYIPFLNSLIVFLNVDTKNKNYLENIFPYIQFETEKTSDYIIQVEIPDNYNYNKNITHLTVAGYDKKEEKYIISETASNRKIAYIQQDTLNILPGNSIYYLKNAVNIFLQFHLENKYSGLSLHASSIIFNNRLILFPGDNDYGKTTIAETLVKKLKSCFILDDDITLLKPDNSLYYGITNPLLNFNDKTAILENVFFIKPVNAEEKNCIIKIDEIRVMLYFLKNITYNYFDNTYFENSINTVKKIIDSTGNIYLFKYYKDGTFENIEYLKKFIENL